MRLLTNTYLVVPFASKTGCGVGRSSCCPAARSLVPRIMRSTSSAQRGMILSAMLAINGINDSYIKPLIKTIIIAK